MNKWEDLYQNNAIIQYHEMIVSIGQIRVLKLDVDDVSSGVCVSNQTVL